MALLSRFNSLELFEAHPKFDEWVKECFEEVWQAIYDGFDRHGDSGQDGPEVLLYQLKRKTGDVQYAMLELSPEVAIQVQGNPEADGIVSVSRDMAVFALLVHLMIWVDERLQKHPEEADIVEVLRKEAERRVLSKYEACLRGNHQLDDAGTCAICAVSKAS